MALHLLNNSTQILLCSYLIFLIGSIIGLTTIVVNEQRAISHQNNDIQWYLEHFGVIPEDYLGRDSQSRPMFSENGQVYVVNDGSYVPIVDAVNAQAPEPVEEPAIPFVSEPNLPIKRLPRCVHTVCNNTDNPLFVEQIGEDETTEFELQFMFHTQVLTTWPLHICETPDDLPLGLEDAEIIQHMNSPSTPFTTSRCAFKNALPTINPSLVSRHRQLWIDDPTTIPPPYRKVEEGPAPQAPIEISKWRLVQVKLVEAIRKKVVPFFAEVIKFIYDYMYTIIGLLAVLFGFYYGYRLIWSDDDGYVPDIQAQSHGDYNEGHSQALQRRNRSTRTINRPRNQYPVGQSQEPMPQSIEATYKIVKRNTIRLKHGSQIVDALGIYGSTILIPRHSYEAIIFYEEAPETIVTSNNFSRTI